MLTVSIPASHKAAGQWAVSVLLGGLLGQEHRFDVAQGTSYRIYLEGRTLELPDRFLAGAIERWRESESVPARVQHYWRWTDGHPEITRSELPVFFGEPGYEEASFGIRCRTDIFGTAFFLLSRYEEIALPHRDAHDRFPASASLAGKSGLLMRPLVNELADFLWSLMLRLWPMLARKRRVGSVRVSCDVDHPFDPSVGRPLRVLRSAVADAIKRQDTGLSLLRVANLLASRWGNHRFDPYNTFNWYMDLCESYGLQVEFYFLAGHNNPQFDGSCRIEDVRLTPLLRAIHRRGHHIGLHGSYNTFQNRTLLSRERIHLVSRCSAAGINVPVIGNRQHYLRWDAKQTAEHLEAAGFEFDTSGGFADQPGFRFGTSQPFQMWGWQDERPLRLVQRPLVLMEAQVLSPAKRADEVSLDTKLALMEKLKHRALRSGGDFTLLWHNSHLLRKDDRRCFAEFLRT